MELSEDAEINLLLQNLYHEDQEMRINAINRLGEIGDELCLKGLREKLKELSPEHQALIIAIGKLKSKYGIG